MGTNKRYADDVDRRMRERLQRRDPQPFPSGLTREAVDPDHDPIRRPDVPLPIKAWVNMVLPETPVQVEALATGWNNRAVEVTWTDEHGTAQVAWVWASAVQNLKPQSE